MKIPVNWSQVTLRNYIAISSLSDLEGLEYKIQLIATLTGEPLSAVERLPISEFTKAAKALEFIKHQPKDKVKVRFKVKGQEFHTFLYTHQLSAGQYMDIMSYCKDDKKIIENLPKILSAFCLPVKRRWWGGKYVVPYDGVEALKRAEFFEENMTMDRVFPIADFFLQVLKNLTPAIATYLERELKRVNKMMMKQRGSLTNGAG